MKALMRVCFGLVLAIGLTAGLGCSENTGMCCGQCKSGKACSADCKKPCCANKGAKCPANCDKPCCKDKKACPADCKKACCKDAKKCPANCTKPCCKDKNKSTTAKPSTGTGSMSAKPMGS